MLRAAYTVGEHAPLKLLLAQDTAAQAGRLLTYHGYLQRARAARIAQLRQELAGLAQVERDILATQAALDRARQEQARQIAQLERDRAARAQAVLAGRDFVTPDDIREVAKPALRHRMLLAPELQIEGQDADAVLHALLAKVDAPRK